MNKKREMRKLALQAERIREFTTQDLQAVIGGGATDPCVIARPTGCNCSTSCTTSGAGGAGTT